MGEPAVIYSLEARARSLCAVNNHEDRTIFLVGSSNIRTKEHHLYRVEFMEDENRTSAESFVFPKGEITVISSSPSQEELCAVGYRTIKSSGQHLNHGAVLGRFKESDEGYDELHIVQDLTAVLGLSDEQACKALVWSPTGDSDDLIAVTASSCIVVDVNALKEEVTINPRSQSEGGPLHSKTGTIHHAARNPFGGGKEVAIAYDEGLLGVDIRSMNTMYTKKGAHPQQTLSVDFNHNRNHLLVSSGVDGCIRFWDVRNMSEPLRIDEHHNHWAWSVKYNQFHDQLLLSCGSDSRVVLSNVYSLCSDPQALTPGMELPSSAGRVEDDEEDIGENGLKEDGVIGVFEEHEDSVYAVEWSATDPWIFASVSYDGRIVFNRMPQEEKYRVLGML
eukprot:Clim_evm42s108 gene=Clim_evmTU42s108